MHRANTTTETLSWEVEEIKDNQTEGESSALKSLRSSFIRSLFSYQSECPKIHSNPGKKEEKNHIQ